jgi:DNA-directed RNA polymerase specialized sigma24 family protein
MRSYDATATREGRWWVVDVSGIGVTQGRTTREAERMAVDLVAVMLDVPAEQVAVEIDFRLGGELAAEVRDVKQAQREAEEAQRQAADKSRTAVRHVLAAGLSKQDAARVLGISAQRVSQLAPGVAKTRVTAKTARTRQTSQAKRASA